MINMEPICKLVILLVAPQERIPQWVKIALLCLLQQKSLLVGIGRIMPQARVWLQELILQQIFLIVPTWSLRLPDQHAKLQLMVGHLLATTQIVQQVLIVVDQMIIMADLVR